MSAVCPSDVLSFTRRIPYLWIWQWWGDAVAVAVGVGDAAADIAGSDVGVDHRVVAAAAAVAAVVVAVTG